MYKAAYPYSTSDAEDAERMFHKQLPSGGGEDLAGNVWIAPEDGKPFPRFEPTFKVTCTKFLTRPVFSALTLADEYKIRPWIVALLDNAKIEVGSKEKVAGTVSSPPPFSMPSSLGIFPPPTELTAPTRARTRRSASPEKAVASPRKLASPRKRRVASAKPEEKKVEEKSESVKSSPTSAKKSSKAPQDKLANGVQKDKASQASAGAEADIVRVAAVKETVETNGGEKTITNTKVSVEMPASHPDLPLPEDTTAMIQKAREMVEEANKLERKPSKTIKRKASSTLTKDGPAEGSDVPVVKKARTELQERLVTERVRNRALIGLTATLAIG
jgi:hypothetical protein